MTERFRLAANALLKRRLNNLVRIDHNVEIDRDYITCAEYQLFIDDMRSVGRNRQPDHWTTERFPAGHAKKPISGVRSSDAKEFCAWLTNKETLSGFKYRLPKLAETKEISANIKDMGCWCKDDDNFIIAGITAQQWQSWQEKRADYIIFRESFIINRDLYLNRDLYRDLYLYLNRDLYLYLYRDLYLYLNLNRDLYLNLNRDLYRDLNLYLNRDLNLNRDLYRDLYLNLNLNRDLYLNLNRDYYKEIEDGQASNLLLLNFPLILPILLYQSLATIYSEALVNRKIRQKLNRSQKEYEQERREYAEKKDNIFQLYAHLVLIDQRQKGNMPAWEGIRIVRERELEI